MNVFLRYVNVGVVNTVLHWGIFFFLHAGLELSQAWSNLSAFSVAVTFSFFANALYTFKANATPLRYIMFIVFMGFLSLIVGALADFFNLPSLMTLITFSALSLMIGFGYSRWVVFRRIK